MTNTGGNRRSTNQLSSQMLRFDARPPRDSSKELRKDQSRRYDDHAVPGLGTYSQDSPSGQLSKRTHENTAKENIKRKPVFKAILIYKNCDEEEDQPKAKRLVREFENDEEISYLVTSKSKTNQPTEIHNKYWNTKSRESHHQLVTPSHQGKFNNTYSDDNNDDDYYWFHKDDTGRLRNRATFGKDGRKKSPENDPDDQNSYLNPGRESFGSKISGHMLKPKDLLMNDNPNKSSKHHFNTEEPDSSIERKPTKTTETSALQSRRPSKSPGKDKPGQPYNPERPSKKTTDAANEPSTKSAPGKKKDLKTEPVKPKAAESKTFHLLDDDVVDKYYESPGEEEAGFSGPAFTPANDSAENQRPASNVSKLSQYRKAKLDASSKDQQVPNGIKASQHLFDEDMIPTNSNPFKQESDKTFRESVKKATQLVPPRKSSKEWTPQEYQFGKVAKDRDVGDVKTKNDESKKEDLDITVMTGQVSSKSKPVSKRGSPTNQPTIPAQVYSKTAKTSPNDEARLKKPATKPAIVPKALSNLKDSETRKTSNSDIEFIKMQKAQQSEDDVNGPHDPLAHLPSESDNEDLGLYSDEQNDYIANNLSQNDKSYQEDQRSAHYSQVSKPSAISKPAVEKREPAAKPQDQFLHPGDKRYLKKSTRMIAEASEDKPNSTQKDRSFGLISNDKKTEQGETKVPENVAMRKSWSKPAPSKSKDKSMFRNLTEKQLHPSEKPGKMLKKVGTEKSFPATTSNSVLTLKGEPERHLPLPKFNEPSIKSTKPKLAENNSEFVDYPQLISPRHTEDQRKSLNPDEVDDELPADNFRNMQSPHFIVPVHHKRLAAMESSFNPPDDISDEEELSSSDDDDDELDLRDEIPMPKPKAPSVGGSRYRKKSEYRREPIEEVTNEQTGQNTAARQSPRTSRDPNKRKAGSYLGDDDNISAHDGYKRPKVELNNMMKRPNERYSVGPELMRQGSSNSSFLSSRRCHSRPETLRVRQQKLLPGEAKAGRVYHQQGASFRADFRHRKDQAYQTISETGRPPVHHS